MQILLIPVFGGLQTKKAFVICLLDSIISKLATCAISIFYLVSIAKETGLSLTLSETRKTGFVAMRPILSVHNL